MPRLFLGLLMVSPLLVQDERAAAWLRERATAVEDLSFLQQSLKDERVVLLGEEVHGVREFTQLKARMVGALVEEHGFTTIAFEQDTLGCARVDEYIKTGEGDPRAALSRFYWCWNNAETLELIEWLRVHNQTAEQPVSFVGVDNQTAGPASARLRALELDDGYDLEPALAPFALGRDAYQARGSAFADEHAEALAELRTWLTLDHDGLALDAAAILEEIHALWTAEDTMARMNARDRHMAARVLELAEEERVIVWAHNAHVSRTTFYGSVEPLGRHVSDRTPALVVGLYFGSGEYLLDPRAREDGDTRELSRPPVDSLARTLAEARSGTWIADLRGDRPEEVERWLTYPPAGHFDNYAAPPSLLEAVDLLLFVESVTPATPAD